MNVWVFNIALLGAACVFAWHWDTAWAFAILLFAGSSTKSVTDKETT